MAISLETWRKTHGFSEAEAPSPTELALRLLVEKGVITPELTEAMLNAVAPEVMAKVRQLAQENSAAPIPEGVDQMLQGGQPPAESGMPPAEEPVAPAPAEPTAPAPVEQPAPAQPAEQAPPGLAEPQINI
jgi:hypothetical protein